MLGDVLCFCRTSTVPFTSMRSVCDCYLRCGVLAFPIACSYFGRLCCRVSSAYRATNERHSEADLAKTTSATNRAYIYNSNSIPLHLYTAHGCSASTLGWCRFLRNYTTTFVLSELAVETVVSNCLSRLQEYTSPISVSPSSSQSLLAYLIPWQYLTARNRSERTAFRPVIPPVSRRIVWILVHLAGSTGRTDQYTRTLSIER